MNPFRRFRIPALAAVCIAASAVIDGAGARQAPAIRITSPTDGTYLMGAVRLTLAFEPAAAIGQVQNVRWFADGTQVCTASIPPYSCEWDAGAMINEHAIRAVATMRNGGRLVASVRTLPVEFAEGVDVDVIQITAVVTDGDGRFVSGLKADDFKVYDENTAQTLTNFAAENIPLELVTAIDVSASMQEALPAVKRRAIDFLAQLRAADQVTVIGFNDTIFTPARRATDQAARARAIGRLAPWGQTALYDAVIHALDLLGRQSGRRALVVFSDGEDQASHASMASVVKRAEASDATIYMIGQGRALQVSALQQLMRQLAAGSGGRAFFSEQEEKLEAIFREILEDLRHQYLLGYSAPDNARGGDLHRIRVEVPGHDYKVRARQSYRLAPRKPQ
ncbi:MAG TPA: VWA domain-containing protein [Vicinamibacterales bacterium]|nr:VWA domain-containing protein [Vicinamibacterales bacterium]